MHKSQRERERAIPESHAQEREPYMGDSYYGDLCVGKSHIEPCAGERESLTWEIAITETYVLERAIHRGEYSSGISIFVLTSNSSLEGLSDESYIFYSKRCEIHSRQ